MKNRTLRMAALFGLAAAGMLVAEERPKVKSEIPFAFRVGKTVMPAGTYTIEQNARSGVVLFKAERGKAAVNTTTNTCQRPLSASDEGTLIFRRYGNTYFLSQIWTPGYNYGREVAKTAAEREMARSERPATGTEIATVNLYLQ